MQICLTVWVVVHPFLWRTSYTSNEESPQHSVLWWTPWMLEALKSPCSQNWGYREKYFASSASQTARVLWLFWVFRSEDKRHCWCDAWLPLHNSSRPEPELLDYLDHLASNRIFRISLCLLLRTQFALDRPALCVHPSPQQLMHKILQFSSNVIIVPCDGFNRSSSWRSWTPSAATIGWPQQQQWASVLLLLLFR